MNHTSKRKLLQVTTDNSPSILYDKHFLSLAIKPGHCNIIFI
ncbi:hypothetical protein M153_13100016638 [Pseudoloma neurophilia]|uniref:Uncharacterized protein n=1 Tax=Pseudoloma neurophilia TaxID=146866 RepID=A0A0R0M083_9MICR|nr:hypothetical protein M153_13100016638 [Pseudoloma neurophilia]